MQTTGVLVHDPLMHCELVQVVRELASVKLQLVPDGNRGQVVPWVVAVCAVQVGTGTKFRRSAAGKWLSVLGVSGCSSSVWLQGLGEQVAAVVKLPA